MKRYDVIKEIDTIEEVKIGKFNPYHDAKGRFSTANGYSSFTYSPGKSKAHDNAIAREKERQTATSSKAMKNPTGNYKEDLKRELEGADYAVQFDEFKGKVRWGKLDLHSTATVQNTGASWAEAAYGNMRNKTLHGNGSKIYLTDKKSYKAAMDATNKAAKKKPFSDTNEMLKHFEKELEKQSLRTVDKDYLQAADNLRRNSK